jgi:hypothetical protein
MTDTNPRPDEGQPTAVILQSTIICPECGHRSTHMMPTDACQYIHVCEACAVQLKPKKGDCCVYCSYGDVPCPPIQEERAGLSTGCCQGSAASGSG